MTHIAILGSGSGVIAGAYELRNLLPSDVDITVISDSDNFYSVPSYSWVAVGWSQRQSSHFLAIADLNQWNISVIQQEIMRIEPQQNQIHFHNGQRLSYDYLIIASEPEHSWSAMPIVAAGSQVYSVCSLQHAEQTYHHFQQLLQDPKPVVIGALANGHCLAAAYDYALVVDSELRQQGLREQIPLTFVTSYSPQTRQSQAEAFMAEQLANHDIPWLSNVAIEHIEGEYLQYYYPQHPYKQLHDLSFSHAVLLPPLRAPSPVADVAGLCDTQGLVQVDKHQRSVSYGNIFAAGKCVAAAGHVYHPQLTFDGEHEIKAMWTAITCNIYAELAGMLPEVVGF